MKKKRRQVAEMRQYDYISKEEFTSHRMDMESRGWVLVEGFYGHQLDPQELTDDYWKFTAVFIKSPMM